MVKLAKTYTLFSDGQLQLDNWLDSIAERYGHDAQQLLQHTLNFAKLSGEDTAGSSGESCFLQGLVMAEILEELKADPETLAATILFPSVQKTELGIDDVRDNINNRVAKLVYGTRRMSAMSSLHKADDRSNPLRIDNMRKMLLAMVKDVRVVLIKLAEQLSILRTAKLLPEKMQRNIAQETRDLYAPLANRLGLGHIKWEMEDYAFRYLEPDTYKNIAKHIAERRVVREKRVHDIVIQLRDSLNELNIDGEISGRAKHIYSIYKKMQRKNVGFDEIYDATAVRILVNTIDDCYTVLSHVHNLWESIPEEFDDYIVAPKPNGYRSLHTAVIGPDDKNLEVQIRTFTMHDEAELGVAAHWIYKEGKPKTSGYEEKIALLRQVLDWEREVADKEQIDEDTQANIIDDRVYVFTPTGDIIDLANGATVLDFAYHIHSEVGHRCRGAKVNGVIAPLTHVLQMGEHVEILTAKQSRPSRDWLNPSSGYLKTSRARAKVLHWFKQQDYDKNLIEGRHYYDREIRRLGLTNINEQKLCERFNFKQFDDLLAALGCGDLRLNQITHAINQQSPVKTSATVKDISFDTASKTTGQGDITILGVGNLLTHIAQCCKPVPGDDIVGYITRGRGVTIHRHDCSDILNSPELDRARLITVAWGSKTKENYPVDIMVVAHDRTHLVRDISNILANEKINILAMSTHVDKQEHIATLHLTVEIDDIANLSRLLEKFHQLPNVIEARRQRS